MNPWCRAVSHPRRCAEAVSPHDQPEHERKSEMLSRGSTYRISHGMRPARPKSTIRPERTSAGGRCRARVPSTPNRPPRPTASGCRVEATRAQRREKPKHLAPMTCAAAGAGKQRQHCLRPDLQRASALSGPLWMRLALRRGSHFRRAQALPTFDHGQRPPMERPPPVPVGTCPLPPAGGKRPHTAAHEGHGHVSN